MTQGVLNADKERHWGKQPTRLAQTASNLSISFLTFREVPQPQHAEMVCLHTEEKKPMVTGTEWVDNRG